MLVFVLNQKGDPLMPCSPRKANVLLNSGKAKVISREPFTIKLLFGSSGHKQEVVAGMDIGSKTIGSAAIANGKVVYQAEVKLRNDISKKLKQRAMYRRTRRGRKVRYRAARFDNRSASTKKGRLAPSVQSKIDAHIRERNFMLSILPITQWKVETASFDIHKISDPDVVDYQKGQQKGYYNTKAFVLARDGYACQSKRKVSHVEKLHVHHIVFRSKGGTNSPDNLITLCELCHDELHAGFFDLPKTKNKTKHATEAGIIQSRLKKSDWKFEETFGYITKFHRENILQLPKAHYNDAVAICCAEGEFVLPSNIVYQKVNVAKGDYQQTDGTRSEKKIPTGKLFGFRKFDYIETPKAKGFIKGKRSSGYFAIMDITGSVIHASVNVKTLCKKLAARSSTMVESVLINSKSTPYLPAVNSGVSRSF